MKKLLYVLPVVAFFLFPALRLSGQDSIVIKPTRAQMSKGSQPGYTVDIPQSFIEKVKKDWINHIQKGSKVKAIEAGYEIQIQGAIAQVISTKPINIYAVLTDLTGKVRLTAFFEIDSAFVEPVAKQENIINDKIDNGIRKYLKDFATSEYGKAIEDGLTAEEKQLDALENDLGKLKNGKEDSEINIAENEQNIKNSEDAIARLDKQNATLIGQITEQEKLLTTTTDELKRTEIQNRLKDLKREKSKVENRREKESKNIVRFRSEIEQNKEEIENNKKSQEEKKQAITQQEEVVKKVQDKRDGVR